MYLYCLANTTQFLVLNKVFDAGLYLHESGLLGASPDAITDEFTVEIKCPWSYCADLLTHVLKKEVQKKQRKKYVVSIDEDGEIDMNFDHPYYHQVQAQIYLSNRQYGYLFIWTLKSHLLVKVEKDLAWERNIDVLTQFYHTYFIPHILGKLD